MSLEKTSRIFVAGQRGMVGSAVVRRLRAAGYEQLITPPSTELDLTQQCAVEAYFKRVKPDCVILAAARVGGILANNTYRAEFIRINLQIQTNVIHAAWEAGAARLLFFSSSCVYPRLCPQPMKEEHLWTGLPEPTNEPYAVAKLAGMSMCQAYNDQYGTRFVSVIPTNLYGPNDNYDPEQSHLMAALIRKFHEAKQERRPQVVLWGSGRPRRELMYVEDAVDAAVFVLQHYDGARPVNVGVGKDYTVREIADLVKRIVGYEGEIVFDANKPDGAPQKLLDVSRLHALGWQAGTDLESGVTRTYQAYLQTRKE